MTRYRALIEPQIVSQQRLKELLVYDPLSGVFTRAIDLNNQCKAGQAAGTVDHNGYLVICIDKRYYKAHRLAVLYMTGDFPVQFVDHIDRNRLNNAWSNLRETDKGGNARNCSLYANNTSGIKGVSFHKQRNKWAANIRLNGKGKHLGLFSTKEDAAKAYELAAREMHGEFAFIARREQ